MGLHVIKTPVRTPVANAIGERVIGTMQRECLELVIALGESHLRAILKAWVAHYNKGRPHMSLGPGIPQPAALLPVSLQTKRHRLPEQLSVISRPILGGLHHKYELAGQAA
jgi:transposase InsO family protein